MVIFVLLYCRKILLSYLLCNDDKLVMASLCLSVSFLQNEGEFSPILLLKLKLFKTIDFVIDGFFVCVCFFYRGQLWMSHC